MVTDSIKVRDKHRVLKKVSLILGIVIIIGVILGGMFMFGFFTGKKEIILINPIQNIVFANTNEAGLVNEQAVIEQGIIEFNADYINYILVALGTGYLHKSPFFENPFIEFVLDEEIWSSEIKQGVPNAQQTSIENEDLRITISKEEAINALLSDNIGQFMKDSYSNENLGIDMVVNKAELFSKGYLEMYKELTGEEISIDNVE